MPTLIDVSRGTSHQAPTITYESTNTRFGEPMQAPKTVDSDSSHARLTVLCQATSIPISSGFFSPSLIMRFVPVSIVASLLLASSFGWAAERPRPNILVIVADDMGYADAGFQGCTDIPTPKLDALAASGVRFTNGYVSGPYCSPTRAGLATGRYQTRFGHEFNPGGGAGLTLSETTMADRLKAAGYATGAVGKWHLGTLDKFHPQKRGFAEFFGFLGGAHAYFAEKDLDILRSTASTAEKEYLTDAFAREAVAFIDAHKREPFFLYLAFNAVHTPMQATVDRVERFAKITDKTRRTYAAMVVAMDEAVGRVMDALRSAGLEDHTLIFFISDNGGPTMPGTTINGSKNDPLRGSKRTTLEGGIRVPFVIAWQGKLPAGKVYHQPAIQLDFLPTAAAAAGIEVQPEWKLDGVNLLPYLLDEKAGPPHKTLYWRFGEQMAIRRGDWKLVRYDLHVEQSAAAGLKGNAVSPARLYNLANDVSEQHDLADREPAKLKELQAAWDAWNAELAPPSWGAPGKTGRTERSPQ
jgi:arylsulfatase A-like enzyme